MYLEQITPLILPNYRIMDNQLLIYWLSGGGVKNLFWIKLCRAECRIVKLFKLGANTPIESESKNTDEQ